MGLADLIDVERVDLYVFELVDLYVFELADFDSRSTTLTPARRLGRLRALTVFSSLLMRRAGLAHATRRARSCAAPGYVDSPSRRRAIALHDGALPALVLTAPFLRLRARVFLLRSQHALSRLAVVCGDEFGLCRLRVMLGYFARQGFRAPFQ